MRLRELTDVSAAVAATRSRKAKTEAIAALLAGAAPDEVAAAVAFLSGRLTQRQIGVGWAQLREPPPPAAEPSLTVAEVDAAFGAIGAMSGAGSQAARRAALAALLERADADEQRFLTRLLLGDLGQGALAGVMAAAIARAAEVPEADVRRALTLSGDLAGTAAIALADGSEGLAEVRLQVGRPLSPMLAATAPDVGAALEKTGPAAVEYKLDGARVQIHRDGDEVAVFTRTLDDVTAHVPEAVEAALALPARTAVLDGEVIALREDGRPHPFQVTGSRFGARRDLERLRREIPLSVFFFDVLHLDGRDLLDAPLSERAAALDALAPDRRIPHTVAEDAAAAQAELDAALAAGHEGVMVKALEAPYAAGRRGAAWLKVKPVHTLDLVVLAAEWGHGRRRGFLSNLHLGARDGDAVAVFTRSLDDVTAHVPEAVEAALALPATRFVLDGEVIALREDGRPHPFQVTGSRFGSRRNLEELRREIPLSVFFFDLLHLDGEDLLDAPLAERASALDEIAPELRIPHAVAEDSAGAQATFDAALAAGHEGVMVKDLDAPYAAGRRGAAWLKVKPVHTLDLVVLAAEWGHGRRRGFLSNLHLGARDGDGFVMLGKTFKGLTDELLAWQTERFQQLETHRDGHTVYVRPEQVVEIAFDGIQTSRRYPGGMALRFARVKRYRDDKPAAEADTVETVRAIAGRGDG
jgi:DNA ligase 1